MDSQICCKCGELIANEHACTPGYHFEKEEKKLNRLDKDWGVVQELKIEADAFTALRGACMVACVENKKASHFIELKDADGGNALALRWCASGSGGGVELPFELDGAEQIAEFVKSWLRKKAIYPDEVPDTDGNTNHGFRIEVREFYDVLVVKPVYIVYGK